MRSPLIHSACAFALTIIPHGARAAAIEFQPTGTPQGFTELAGARQLLVDVYVGGRKVAEALAVAKPGTLQFQQPQAVLSAVPEIIASPELQTAIAAELPTNSQALCSLSNRGSCGRISPPVVGIIYDEDHFRIDLFVNPQFLRTAALTPTGFLPVPDAPLSLTNSFGLAASGTVGSPTAYNLQNRTVIGLHNARIRADTSLASHFGFIVDDLVGEVDRRNLRYSGGLFWTPGNDFTGQRRIMGLGVGTQLDTRADRDELRGTPLILFLPQPARVELLVDGRLAGSRSYPAGNVDIDSSALPDGSYPLLMRIHEANGAVREERRFFVKNAQLAPLGHPILYAYAGMLANTRRDRPVSISNDFYYQAGAAWRITNKIALELSSLGTQHKGLLEAGAWLLKGRTRVRAAGLVSTSGDTGALMQVSAGERGPLNLSVDVRRIWSRDGDPLIPLSNTIDSFGTTPPTGLQVANGSYTQATGSVALSLRGGYVSLVGSYRKDRSFKADYSIGPSINWPLITHNQLQLVFEASAQRTRSTTAAFAGLRMLLTKGDLSLSGRAGQAYQKDGGGADSAVSRPVGSLSVQYSHEQPDRTLLHVEAGLDRDIQSSSIHAGTRVDSRFGDVRADLLHNLEGRNGTQFDLAYQSAVAISAHASVWGARDLDQSAMVITVTGDARDAIFDVLVDDVARGRVKAGQQLSLFVPAYRTYEVRVVPVGALPIDYDSGARAVTLYPGNVKALAWRAQSLVTIFAQAVAPGGERIANALVQSPKSVGETDANGYFQIDVRRGDAIAVHKGDGAECRIALANNLPTGDFASLGRVICQ